MYSEPYAFFYMNREPFKPVEPEYLKRQQKISKRLDQISNSLNQLRSNNVKINVFIDDALLKLRNAKQQYEKQLTELNYSTDCTTVVNHYELFINTIENMLKNPADAANFSANFLKDDSLNELSSSIETRDKTYGTVTVISAAITALLTLSAIVSMAAFGPIGLTVGFVLLATAGVSLSVSVGFHHEKSNGEIDINSTVSSSNETMDSIETLTKQENSLVNISL